MNRRLASLLSLSQKAGMLVSGETACEKALRGQSVKLMIICEDASFNTKKKFANKAFYYNVPCYIYGSKEEINKAVGKSNRSSFAIIEENFKIKIEGLLKQVSEATCTKLDMPENTEVDICQN